MVLLMQNLDKIFARRFSSKVALDALIKAHLTIGPAHRRVCLDQQLAVNLNLSAEQITALFRETEQLESFRDTNHIATATLLATRLDLTPDHIWSILKSSNRMVRQALFNPGGEIWNHTAALDDQMMDYLLAQKWLITCDPDMFSISAHMDLFRLSKEASAQLRAAYNTRYPDNPLMAETGRSRDIRGNSHSWSDTYRKRDDLRREIQLGADWEYYYLNQNPTAIKPSEVDEKYYKALDHPIGSIKLNGTRALRRFCWVVEDATKSQNEEFYKMFFSLLQDWKGSINELIRSAASLTGGAAS